MPIEYDPNLSIKENIYRLTSKYEENIQNLKEEYNSNLTKLIIESMDKTAGVLRNRNKLKPIETTPKNEEEIGEASDFIQWFEKRSDKYLEEMHKTVRKQCEFLYQQAKTKIEENIKINLENEDILIYVEEGKDKISIFPSIYYEDIEENPSLMLNLLEYCLAACESEGLKLDLPEKYGKYVRINAENEGEKNLKEILSSGKPKGFEEKRLELLIITNSDHNIFQIKANNFSEKPEENQQEILEDKIGLFEEEIKAVYSIGEAAERLGIYTDIIYFYQSPQGNCLIPKRSDEKGKRYLLNEDLEIIKDFRRKNPPINYSLKEAAMILNEKLNHSLGIKTYFYILNSHIKKKYLQIINKGGRELIKRKEFDKFLTIENIEKELQSLKKRGIKSISSKEAADILNVKSIFIKKMISQTNFEKDITGGINLDSILNYISQHPDINFNK